MLISFNFIHACSPWDGRPGLVQHKPSFLEETCKQIITFVVNIKWKFQFVHSHHLRKTLPLPFAQLLIQYWPAVFFSSAEGEEDKLRSSEQELHVLRSQFVQCNLVIIDGTVDHVGFLLLEEHHPRFDRVFNTKASDDAGTTLANAVASIGGLPFGGRIPPPSEIG